MAFTKIAAAGIGSTETVTLHSLEVLNNATVGGVLTYEDVTNVDSVGLITARAGIVVGSGITLSKDGDIFATGVTTATSFVGDGSQLTGVASTENIRTNTNATFLQNINVSGSTTTGSLVSSGAVSGTTGTFSGAISGTTGTFTSDVTLSSTAPKIVFTDSNNNPDFELTVNGGAFTVTDTTNSADRLKIDSAGLVGLGINPSLSLHVYHATNNGILRVESGDSDARIDIKDNSGEVRLHASGDTFTINTSSSDTERARIDSSGNVIIGGTSLNNSAVSGQALQITGTTRPTLILRGNASGSNVGEIQFADNSGSDDDNTGIRAGLIQYDHGSNYMAFRTSATERLRITSSGYVGINQSSPGTGLHVSQDWVANYGSISVEGSADALVGMGLRSNGSYEAALIWRDGSSGDYLELATQNSNPILFKTNNSERLRIASSGQIGLSGANYGSSGQVLTSQGSSSAATWTTPSGGLFASYAIICDQKSTGTSGGSFNSGEWRQRDLNTEIADPDGIVSIASNAFTLQAGTYLIKIMAPAYGVARHQCRLRNSSDSSTVFYGQSAFTHASHYNQSNAIAFGRVTIGSAKAFVVQHRCDTSRSTSGFGVSADFGASGQFTIVEIFKES